MSTWQFVGFGCSWSAELQFVSSAFRFAVSFHNFQPCCKFQLVCNHLARLRSVDTAAHCHLLCSSALGQSLHMSFHLESVNLAVFCQSCILSALACFFKQFICCDRPHFSYELQAPLQSVISAAICHLSLLAQLQHSSLTAMCQLSCYLKAQLQLVTQPSGSAATCQLSCTLSSQLQHVG